MQWIKLWTQGWIFGSGRTMTPEKRGVWVDLLALAGEAKFRDGTLRFEVDKPMTKEWIANTLMLEMETLEACLVAFKSDINADDGQPRINIWEDGTIEITNWEKYQGKPEQLVAKQVAIEKAKETKQRQKTATDKLIQITNQLTIAMRKQQPIVAVSCPFCNQGEITSTIDLARHIWNKQDDEHIAGLGWAKQYLGKEEVE